MDMEEFEAYEKPKPKAKKPIPYVLYFSAGLLWALVLPVALYYVLMFTEECWNIAIYDGDFLGAPQVFLIAFLGLALISGLPWGLFVRPPKNTFARFFPLALPFYAATIGMSYFVFAEESIFSGYDVLVLVVYLYLAVFYALFMLFVLLGGLRHRPMESKIAGFAALVILFILCAGPGVYYYYDNQRHMLSGPDIGDDDGERFYAEGSHGHDINTWEYLPFNKSNYIKTYVPDFPVSLQITENYPRLDGAIALLPVYASFVNATYKGLDDRTVGAYFNCTNTPNAFARLLKGEIDIFFGVPPSQQQQDDAAARSLNLVITPIAREAFIFFVHKDNPVNDLTQDQIRDIYSKTTTNWKDVGGSDLAIMPFQRPEGSGSQSAMQNMVMKSRKLTRPLKEEFHEGMGGIIRGVAAYRNGPRAIGFSFRWYATVLINNPDVKVLSVDGVHPNVENIRNGKYPLCTSLVAMTARPLSLQSQSLMGWILGPEGQKIIEKVGYVPIESPAELLKNPVPLIQDESILEREEQEQQP